MFTGIIEELGKVRHITNNQITIECCAVLEDVKLGDSIAVNGACLTVVNFSKDSFVADVSPETLRVTSLENLKSGTLVNLERALKVGERLGGHIITGHIDGIGKCLKIEKTSDFYNVFVELNPEQAKYTIKKGSIAIDGISLTIANMKSSTVEIAVIPHTFENTNFKTMQIGQNVNIETDILSKYVEKFLSTSDNKASIDLNFLKENGF